LTGALQAGAGCCSGQAWTVARAGPWPPGGLPAGRDRGAAHVL